MSRVRVGLVGLVAVLTLSALGTGHSGAQSPRPARTEVAIFAGGCFWSTEKLFEETRGVIEAVSGYTGGSVPEPTYEQVVRGRTGHREAVRVTFDPTRVSYAQLVESFWRSIDPADAGGVICDRGFQYTTALFVTSEAQRQAALASKARLEASGVLRGRPVATQILRAQAFWPAEPEHQDYWRTNKLAYLAYVRGCGREAALARVWGRGG